MTKAADKPQVALGELELVNASQIAALWGISRSTLGRMIAAQVLPAPIELPPDGVRKWRKAELDAWVSAGCPDRTLWQWKPVKLETLEEHLKRKYAELREIEDLIDARRRELERTHQA